MKAIRIYEHGSPGVMKIEEVTDPEPGAGHVLMKVRAAGVNPVDTYLRSGIQGYTVGLPYTPGMDAAGVIEVLGDGATGFTVGDRVYCSGTVTGAYAEKTLCGIANIHPLPEKISFAEGASIGVPYGTAYRALFQRAGAESGETVLVHGASGGVGLAAVQIAKAAGLTVIGTAGSDEGRRLVEKEGAHFATDHHHPDHLNDVLEFTDRMGVNIILEMLANVNLSADLPVLAKNGRVVVIGSRGDVEITPRELMRRDADIRGMILMNAGEKEMEEIHLALIAGFENGTLRPVVASELPLVEAPSAHRLVMEGNHLGNIVLIP